MSWGAVGGGVASAVVGGAMGGGSSGGSGGGGGRAQAFQMQNNPFFAAQMTPLKGNDFTAANATGALGDLQGQQVTDAGMFNQFDMQNQGSDRMNQLGMGFLNNMDAFSPEQIMQQQFNIMNPMMQRQFDQQNLNAENRLFSQGRLGSTGGSLQQEAMFRGQGDATAGLLGNSFGLGLQAQAQQVQKRILRVYEQLIPARINTAHLPTVQRAGEFLDVDL